MNAVRPRARRRAYASFRDTRMFYCLEKLWADGDNVEFYPEKK